MDPKKPSSDSPEERVEALVRGRDGRSAGAQAPEAGMERSEPDRKAKGGHRAPLTEKQRIEARRKRQEQRRRRGTGRGSARRGSSKPGTAGAAGGSGNALSRGVRATGTEIRRTALFLVGALAAGLDRLGPVGTAIGSSTGRFPPGRRSHLHRSASRDRRPDSTESASFFWRPTGSSRQGRP